MLIGAVVLLGVNKNPPEDHVLKYHQTFVLHHPLFFIIDFWTKFFSTLLCSLNFPKDMSGFLLSVGFGYMFIGKLRAGHLNNLLHHDQFEQFLSFENCKLMLLERSLKCIGWFSCGQVCRVKWHSRR